MQEFDFVSSMAKVNMNPAEQITLLALKNGYRPKVEENNDELQPRGSNKPSVDLAKVKRNHEKTASLIGGTTKGGSDALTANHILQMTPQQLAKMSEEAIKSATRGMTMIPQTASEW